MENLSHKDVRRIFQRSHAAKKIKIKLTKSALKPYFICMIGKKVVVELNENSSAIGNLQHFDNDMNLICKDASFITKNGSITKTTTVHFRHGTDAQKGSQSFTTSNFPGSNVWMRRCKRELQP
ncbi:Molybdenum cofactor sulfurase [Trichinella pseudospiralis]